jgi:hypothetical protein
MNSDGLIVQPLVMRRPKHLLTLSGLCWLIAKDAWIKADLDKQIADRPEHFIQAWDSFCKIDLDIISFIRSEIMQGIGWSSDRYIPEDSMRLLLWEEVGPDLRAVETLCRIEEHLGLCDDPELELNDSFGRYVIRLCARMGKR